MKKILIVALFTAALAGCRSAVPANVAVDAEVHNLNVQELHTALQQYVRADAALVDGDLAADPSDQAAKDKRSILRRWLLLSAADQRLSQQLKDWALKYADEEDVDALRTERAAQAKGQ